MAMKPTHGTLSSDEINYIVHRYLQESGYVHTAFTFGIESHVSKSKIDGSQIQPGAFLSFVQRGVTFVEIEERLLKDSKDSVAHSLAMDGHTSFEDVHRCLYNHDFQKGNQGKSSVPGNGTGPIGIDEKDTGMSGENSGETHNLA